MENILLKNIGDAYFIPGIGKGDSVSIINGRISFDMLPETFYSSIIDCSGLSLSPGWIDMHTHIYKGVCDIAMDPDRFGPATGVTGLVDAGSAGCITFGGLRDYIIKQREYSIFEFLNYGSIGITRCNVICDYETDDFIQPEEVEEVVKINRDYIRGLKVRACKVVLKGRGIEIVKDAADLAHRLGIPLMVHIGEPLPTYEEVLDVLDKGDIVTHCFHGKPGNLVSSGHVPEYAVSARRRGVLFDVGHGGASFDYHVGAIAMSEGFFPDLISTDLHTGSYNKAGSLADVMSKIHALSMPIPDVIRAVSVTARNVLRIEDYSSGCAGNIADLTLFSISHEHKQFVDSVGNVVDTYLQFVPEYCIANGKLYTCSKERV